MLTANHFQRARLCLHLICELEGFRAALQTDCFLACKDAAAGCSCLVPVRLGLSADAVGRRTARAEEGEADHGEHDEHHDEHHDDHEEHHDADGEEHHDEVSAARGDRSCGWRWCRVDGLVTGVAEESRQPTGWQCC